MFQEICKSVSRVLQGRFRGDLRKFTGCLKGIS